MKKQIANMITGFRILCSIVLILLPVFSVQFYIVYLVCGLSDMADGAVARRTNSTSSFGSKLDTAADIIFVVAAVVCSAATFATLQEMYYLLTGNSIS